MRFGFGAGVDRRHHAPFEQRFGFPLLEAWAMTETGAGAVVIANREPRHVGTELLRPRRSARVQWRLVDDDGDDVPTGEPGELLVRAAGADPRRGFFSGYLKDEAATAEAWADGWFHTGDMVRRDADGQLYFVDRRKNVIRRSGENISAVEVESVLRPAPARGRGGGRGGTRRAARRRGAGLRRAARARRRTRRQPLAARSRSTRWSSSPTTRRRATSPSSTRCRSRRRRRSSAAS